MNEDTKHRILLGVLVVLIVALLGLVGVIYRQIKTARETLGLEDSLVSATVTPEANLSISYDLGSPSTTNAEVLDDVKDVANRFMEARVNRSLEEAQPYMTDDLRKTTTQDEFAGTSSPSMDRFEITKAQALKTPDTYQVDITSYWKLNGEDAQTVQYKLIVLRVNDQYLVNKFEESSANHL